MSNFFKSLSKIGESAVEQAIDVNRLSIATIKSVTSERNIKQGQQWGKTSIKIWQVNGRNYNQTLLRIITESAKKN